MWWFDNGNRHSSVGNRIEPTAETRLPKRASRLAMVIGGLALSLPLAGCIEPLYAPSGLGFDSSPLATELQAIAVDEIPQRLGHYVRNELIFGFNGTGSSPTPRYRLMVNLRERVQTPILDTVTGRATSATVIVDADYRLVTLPGEKEVTKGVATGIASYDRFSNRFSNVRAARDAEIRDAKVIADSIRTRVATALAMRR